MYLRHFALTRLPFETPSSPPITRRARSASGRGSREAA